MKEVKVIGVKEQQHWNWLVGKLQQWATQGIIDRAQADRILMQRPQFQQKSSLLVRILIAFSALLFGLAVISFFAFNWQYMPKWLKLLVIYSSFIGAHAAALWYGRIPERKAITEFLHLLGTFLFGAGIMLITQVYHIVEHAPNGVFLWSLGALLMAYVLQSTPQMILFGVLAIVWQGMEVSFRTRQYWAILLIAAVTGLFALRKRHWFPAAIASVTTIVVTLMHLLHLHPDNNIAVALIGLGSLYIACGILIRRSFRTDCALPFEVPGYVLYFGVLAFLSFREALKEVMRQPIPPSASGYPFHSILTWAIIVFALLLWSFWCILFPGMLEKLRNLASWHTALVPVTFIVTLFVWLISGSLTDQKTLEHLMMAAFLAFNLLMLAHGLVLIISGTREGRIGTSFLGCIIFLFVVLARFADISSNLLVQSAAFALGGAFILFIALKTAKVKKPKEQT
ncbi:DUF2157 domain-containing protein [bacterium]|nr:DUF2157 domain-containing protein [bacterium]